MDRLVVTRYGRKMLHVATVTVDNGYAVEKARRYWARVYGTGLRFWKNSDGSTEFWTTRNFLKEGH